MPAVAVCRACGSALEETVLDLGTQCVTDFVEVPGTAPLGAGRLHFAVCGECALVQLAESMDLTALFARHWFRSGLNEAMVRALGETAERAADAFAHRNPRRPSSWLDIGCNDGTLLAQVTPARLLVGCDPTLDAIVSASSLLRSSPADVRLDPVAFSGPWARAVMPPGGFDVVTACAMFYDLEAPWQFLSEVREVTASNGILLLQLNDLCSMVAQNAVDNICHEHVTYWSLFPLLQVAHTAGWQMVSAERIALNGGSLRVILTPRQRVNGDIVLPSGDLAREESVWASAAGVRTRLAGWRRELQRIRIKLIAFLERAQGPWWMYGASSRGNTLLQWLDVADIPRRRIYGCAERDAAKFGRFTVGTNLPILPEDTVRPVAQRFMCLPWHHWDTSLRDREAAWTAADGEWLIPLPAPVRVTRERSVAL